jgi:energy-coupling factor transporter ATP-binding protein EcfA2
MITLPVDVGQTIFVLGANGSGKSGLMHRFYRIDPPAMHRISAHRQLWFSSATNDLSARNRLGQAQNMRNADTNLDSRWKDDYSAFRISVALYDLEQAENSDARAIAGAVRSAKIELASKLAKKDSPLKILNQLLRESNLSVEISIEPDQSIIAKRSSGNPYSIAELSDGERAALLIAAEVLTVEPGKLILIDEPERHLHRSIISPLLTNLFSTRSDCGFVVSTHEVLLPVDNPSARTLLVRGCRFEGPAFAAWDADLVSSDLCIDDEVKKDILGGRNVILFVEGIKNSLDRLLYSLIFPNVSIVPKESCRDVERATLGIRTSEQLHWIKAFGIIDSDNRSKADMARLRSLGVYALSVHSVESIYYRPEIQRLVAERHSSITGAKPGDGIVRAEQAVLDAVSQHADRLSRRVVEQLIREEIFEHLPTQETLDIGAPINVVIDIASKIAAERKYLETLINARDVAAIIERYPVRETPAPGRIASSIGFRSRVDYEAAVRKLLLDNEAATTSIRSLFGSLYADINS